jgi:hypothetical protein
VLRQDLGEDAEPRLSAVHHAAQQGFTQWNHWQALALSDCSSNSSEVDSSASQQ